MISENKTEYLKNTFADYKGLLTTEDKDEINQLAKLLAGKKVIHLNATPKGGGVVEILKSLVPLQQSLGIKSQWFTFTASPEFFEITKKIHNGLQGADLELTPAERKIYLNFNKTLAREVEKLKPDVLVVHDPQPLAVIKFLPKTFSVARMHPDITDPNPQIWDFLKQFLLDYDVLAFSLPEYVHDLDHDKVVVSPPAIDPFSDKNKKFSDEFYAATLEKLGLNPNKPLLVQVARFDPWKDYLGVISAYKVIKKNFPNAQLALAGVIEAQDDPEAYEVLKEVRAASKDDPDIKVFGEVADVKGVPLDVFVNCLQSSADVVFMKSIREGFGMVVSEAMWKGEPVVGGDVGGIKLQIQDKVNGFLVNSIQEAVNAALTLLSDKEKAMEMGKRAIENVKKNFLITRLLKDELNIYLS